MLETGKAYRRSVPVEVDGAAQSSKKSAGAEFTNCRNLATKRD